MTKQEAEKQITDILKQLEAATYAKVKTLGILDVDATCLKDRCQVIKRSVYIDDEPQQIKTW